jgi:DNA processing protein
LGLPTEARSDTDFWLLLARAQVAGGVMAAALERFGSARGVFSASARELCDAVGMRPASLRRLIRVEGGADLAIEREALARSGARLVTLFDPAYPDSLRDLPDPPPCLFTLGDVSLMGRESVAIVGSRGASESALRDAEVLAGRLAANGVPIVSGLAIGVDAAAHRGALRGGTTLAVLGCGIDVDYPRENSSLRREITERGLVVTELPLGAHAWRSTFPKRNRIIAALARVTVVVGARAKSGALLTIAAAQALGRAVAAVPSDTRDSRHRGSLALLKSGIALVESADDVLRLMNRAASRKPDPARKVAPPVLSATEERTLAALDPDPQPVDTVAERAHLDAPSVSAALLLLEVKGLARRHPGGAFSREG